MKKILIVGAGGIGKKHIDGFLRSGFFSVSICEVNEEKIKEVKEKYKIEKVHKDFFEVNLKNFDAVLIATPANLHIPMAIRCAKENIPFFVEKPLSLDTNGIEKLINIIKKNKIPSAVGFTRRSVPSFIRFEELLKEKNIIPKIASFVSGCDYRKYRPDYEEIYFAKKKMGGGCLLDSVSHIVDLAQWYLGNPSDGFCIYDNLVFGNTIETEDCAVICSKFGNSLVSISNNLFQKPYTLFIEIVGENGTLRYIMDSREKAIITFSDNDTGKWEELGRFENEIFDYYLNQAKNFYNLLEGKYNTLTTIEEAYINLEFILKLKSFYKKDS